MIQKPLLRASLRFFKKFWYQATYYRFPSVWTLFSSLFKNRPKCPTKEFVPGTKKCQKSRTNTGELTTSGESISGHCTHSTQVKETQHFHRFQKHQEHQFKSYFKNCFFSLSGTSHDFKLLFGVGLWLQLDQKKKEKKNRKSRFFDNIWIWPCIVLFISLANHLKRVIKHEQWNQNTVNIVD